MKIFLDTEYADLMTPDLISIGAISEDEKYQFYVEINDYKRSLSSEFVKQHVEPLLDNPKFGVKYIEAGQDLREWFLSLPWKHPGELEIAITSGDDWALMVELLGTIIPYNVKPIPTMIDIDLKTQSCIRAMQKQLPFNDVIDKTMKEYILGFTDYFFSGNPQHHALHDAKASCNGWAYAMKQLGAE